MPRLIGNARTFAARLVLAFLLMGDDCEIRMAHNAWSKYFLSGSSR